MPEKIIVVATDDEYNKIRPLTKLKIVKTGIGFVNATSALKDLDKSTPIINIGYAGSNTLPRGTVAKVRVCKPYHPISQYNYPEPEFNLGGNVDCFTAGDFVVKTDIKNPVVFDMELASICALGFKKIIR